MIYKTETDTPLETVRKELEAKAKDYGFGVLKQYNFKKILEEKGFPIDKDITVFELCNPAAAQGALNAIEEISVYLPCRVAIFAQNNKTKLTTIGVEDMLKNFDLNNEFKTHMSQTFENLKSLMNSWK